MPRCASSLLPVGADGLAVTPRLSEWYAFKDPSHQKAFNNFRLDDCSVPYLVCIFFVAVALTIQNFYHCWKQLMISSTEKEYIVFSFVIRVIAIFCLIPFILSVLGHQKRITNYPCITKIDPARWCNCGAFLAITISSIAIGRDVSALGSAEWSVLAILMQLTFIRTALRLVDWWMMVLSGMTVGIAIVVRLTAYPLPFNIVAVIFVSLTFAMYTNYESYITNLHWFVNVSSASNATRLAFENENKTKEYEIASIEFRAFIGDYRN
jgi:hypothetical protein